MLKKMISLGCFTIFCVLTFLNESAVAKNTELQLTWDKKAQVLTADIKKVPLEKVTKEIEKKTDVWCKSRGAFPKKDVTAKFKSLPIEEAVKRLLVSVNYALIYDKKGKLKGIYIMNDNAGGKSKTKESEPEAIVEMFPPMSQITDENQMPPSVTESAPPTNQDSSKMPPPAKILPPITEKKEITGQTPKSESLPPVSGSVPK